MDYTHKKKWYFLIFLFFSVVLVSIPKMSINLILIKIKDFIFASLNTFTFIKKYHTNFEQVLKDLS